QLFEKYPEAIIGILVARNLDNHGENQEINSLLRQEESKIRSDFDLENLAQSPLIQNWRKAYKLFGSDDRCSSEALIRLVLKGNQIRHINKLVDIYNYISLKYRTPVGGEDLDKIEGNIYLKFADGKERFVVLGSTKEENPKKGEVVYADDKEVICRRWNWRESENTKLTEETKNAFLVIDALPPINEEVVKKALEEFGELVKRYCNADIQMFILNVKNRQIEF
ncbi:MAG: phenylalanine--tRNA ligase beta subunit-related protein, partial [Candidatus Aenigmatarchaeota archaeon]